MIPKLKVPLNFSAGAAAIVEQDSQDEIAQCVVALLRTEIESRVERMEYGIVDPTFRGVVREEIREIIAHWEPRAELTIEGAEDLDELVSRTLLRLEESP